MSEPQFAYSGLTLDELRSMAASPQVGTMQAMPQSFRALADRVGEVADLLSHAQADLPNWWKGPAAEQAAATLGRAAAEAREFQGSALAAASAVSRCAQVVAVQQHQMMNVPDVQEPGITDVVQRPTTPFEALEAARQDATYQAAHEEAVQAVNGIAAQYIETHSELAMITIKRGDSFDAQRPIQSLPLANTTVPPSSDAVNRESRAATGRQSSESRYESVVKFPTAEEIAGTPNRNRVSSRTENAHSLSDESVLGPKGARTLNVAPYKSAPVSTYKPTTDRPSSSSTPDSQSRNEEITNDKQATSEILDRESGLTNISHAFLAQEPSGEPASSPPIKRRIDRAVNITQNARNTQKIDGLTNRREPWDTVEDHSIGSTSSNSAYSSPQATDRSQIDNAGSDNATMIPPYSSAGSVGRSRERSPRPAYLKERESTWLPDTIAAPADGVIGPDLLEFP